MKNVIITIVSVFLFIPGILSQTVPNGMKYQAIARDLDGEVMSNQEVALQIRLQSSLETPEIYYTEQHRPTTNQFGLFSIVIGEGIVVKGDFNEIPWSTGEVWIEIAISEDNTANFKTISNSQLYAVPYAFHANTASSVESNKGPDGPGNGNVWKLVGNTNTDPNEDKLGTADETDLNIVTNDIVRLKITSEGNSLITGDLTVGDPLDNKATNLNGQVTVNAAINGSDTFYGAYPLRVEGGKQGIAVKVTEDEPGPENNWITFFNTNDEAIARIEGNANVVSDAILIIEATLTDQNTVVLSNGNSFDLNNESDKSFLREKYFKNDTAIEFAKSYSQALWHAFMTGIKLGIAIPTAGVEADFDDTIDHLKDCVKGLIQAEKIILLSDQPGASYSSGGADYAEWLLKAYPNESISFGEVVGVKGGTISKTFTDASQFMAITSNPIIVGAMPEKNQQSKFKKVALMGQVPILVLGNVNIGDYILPSGDGDGTAKAVNPDSMKANDFSKVIGISWQKSDPDKIFNYINTAVGFNSVQIGSVVNTMQTVINSMQQELANLNPNYKPIFFDTVDTSFEGTIPANSESESASCYTDCGDETFGIDRFQCYMLCWLEGANVSSINSENNAVIRLMQKLRSDVVYPRTNLITNAVNDIFPDVTVLDKIPEIKDIILDIMDGPPFSPPSDLATIVDKLKTRMTRVDYFID